MAWVLWLDFLAKIAFLRKILPCFGYFFKFSCFLILSLISASIFLPVMVFRPMDFRNTEMPNWGFRQISKLLKLKWTIVGKENIVKNQGCVVVINHQSSLDLLVLAEIWPALERCVYSSKKEVFYLWPFGLAAWLSGTVFIDRSSRQRSRDTMNKVAENIATQKDQICMFPEGTRHQGNELLPFKKGAFHMAIKSQTPIQPVVVSKYTFLDSKTYKFEPGLNTIKFLPAIPTKGMNESNIDDLIEKTYTAMSQEFKSLSKL